MRRYFASNFGKESDIESILDIACQLKSQTDEALLKKIKKPAAAKLIHQHKRSIIRAIYNALPRFRSDFQAQINATEWLISFSLVRGFVDEAVRAHLDLWKQMIDFQLYDQAPAAFKSYYETTAHAQEEGYTARLDSTGVIVLEEQFDRLSIHSRLQLAIQSGAPISPSLQSRFDHLLNNVGPDQRPGPLKSSDTPTEADVLTRLPTHLIIPPATIATLSAIPDFTLIADSLTTASIRLEILNHAISSQQAYKQKNIESALAHAGEVLKLSQSTPHILDHTASLLRYLRFIKKAAVYKNHLGDDLAHKAAAQLFDSLKSKFPEAAASIFSYSLYHRLHHSIIHNTPANRKIAIDQFEEYYEKYAPRISPQDRVFIYYYFALLNIYAGLPKQALPFILDLRHQPLQGAALGHRVYSWLLFLFAHQQLGNWEVIERELPATRKSIQPFITSWEETILQGFEKAVAAHTQGKPTALTPLRTALAGLATQPEFKFHFDYFDFSRLP